MEFSVALMVLRLSFFEMDTRMLVVREPVVIQLVIFSSMNAMLRH